MALTGGVVLLLLVLITTLSIVGRQANSLGHIEWLVATLPWLSNMLTKLKPINGDFEMVEAGVAFAILAFFPWCMLQRGHATVDVFTGFFPEFLNRGLTLVWDIVFALAMIVITWRLYEGTENKYRYGETTLMLEYPVWWGFAACTFAAGIASVVCVYMVVARIVPPRENPGV